MTKRTRLGFLHALRVQYEGLRLSAAAFDNGHQTEAVRMANAIFVMIGPDSRNHKSILGQLEDLTKFEMISTADPRGPHGSALIAVELVPYVAEEGTNGWIISAGAMGHEELRRRRTVHLLNWWGEQVLGAAGLPQILSRLQVVRILRDQDGGAHLDDHIKDDTYIAAQLKGVGFQYRPSADSDETRPVEGAIEATVRQMAYEVLESLKKLAMSAQVSLSRAAMRAERAGVPLSQYFFEDKDSALE